MSRRMNYGPRFRSGAVSVGYHYDPSLDPKIPGGFLGMSTRQRLFNVAKAQSVINERRRSQPPASTEYLDAQKRLIERIRQAVTLIEFGLVEVNDAARAGGETIVSRQIIMKAVETLRHKCGIKDW